MRRPLKCVPLLPALSILCLGFLSSAAIAEETPKLLGAITEADLREAPYAEWFESNHEAYAPSAETVEVLRQGSLEGLEIEIFFGTWCGDSRREVPRFLRLLDTIDFPEEARRLIAVDDDEALHKRSPGGEEVGKGVFRVPTLIVKKGDDEVGRIVEHPVLSLERDLLAITGGGNYQSSYASYPVVRRWLAEGLLSDPNISADGLGQQVRELLSSESELYSAARVLRTRGQVREGAKLMEANCSVYWQSSRCHERLAEAWLHAGEPGLARESVMRALERDYAPERLEGLIELVDRSAPGTDDGSAPEALEEEIRAAETAFAAAFAAGDMDAFADLVAPEATFWANGKPLRGKAAIVERWRGIRGDGEARFSWKPERVAVTGTGEYGFSTGPVSNADGKWTSSYVSTWKRTPEGWRVILDIGPRCPPKD